MKTFNRLLVVISAVIAVIFVIINSVLLNSESEQGRPYLVEISRLANKIENGEAPDVSECKYVTCISKNGDNIYNSQNDYAIREINGELYRFEYKTEQKNNTSLIFSMNIIVGCMAFTILAVMLYIRVKILKPLDRISDVPCELAKGNLTAPLKENKNRFFGKLNWGMDMLRETTEKQKKRELELQKEKKTLLLSLSHDIKTPLSAIKLYSKAITKGLYTEKEKMNEIALNINAKADEIEDYVSRIVMASREDFLCLEVCMGEVYLSEIVTKIKRYYKEKLELIKIDFSVSDFDDCLIRADCERAVEVLQNIIENAVKYGDGNSIKMSFSEEDDCIIVEICNSGCNLSENEIPHIFESFYRGTNAGNEKGSGLGLYICRQLMHKMNGEIFAKVSDGFMCVTVAFSKL